MYACLAWFQISPCDDSGAGGGGGGGTADAAATAGAADADGTADAAGTADDTARLADTEGLGVGGRIADNLAAGGISVKGAFAGSGGGLSLLASITHRVNVTNSHKFNLQPPIP